MNKISIIGAIAVALIGGGLIWTAGNGDEQGITGWETLNAEVAKAIESGQTATVGGSPVSDSENAASRETDKIKEAEEADGNPGRKSGDDKDAASQENAKSVAVPNGDGAGYAARAEEGGSLVTDASARDRAAASRAPAADAPASAEGKVNVNTAGISELTALPGIGEKKAQSILDYRNQHGAFHNASDLGKVKGIGPKMLEKLRPYVLF
ncbi:competence protein ComEA [Paenibacillus sophorae]|uniref:Competence protein ComEA n=1 Tax=Paenibacillus sophorae TaxID=1333845 RepID=A0A1H8RCZ8_9BACL|nr:helix-hairpin-helix domain-containing protein [Paenibacillus sophorae]QWU15035.1 helix-hairpin-helix domain-containing protein [Paenibacillus sophorae]SEO64014.1 competence protein ComEA [Paenibacillus sophorae]